MTHNNDSDWSLEEETPVKAPEVTFQMTEDQQRAFDKVMAWLRTPIRQDEDHFFSLSGSAGTGKTTVLKMIFQGLPHPYAGRTCVSAPTHKARKVVAFKSGCTLSETIQGLLGMKPDTSLEEFDIDNVIFSPIANRKIANYRLIIPDEASMINSDLYDLMKQEAIKNGTRILFVGDSFQLPPVKEATSRALAEPLHKCVLTQIVRQSDTNPLILLLDTLRNDIANTSMDVEAIEKRGDRTTNFETNNFITYMKENPAMYNDKGEGFEVLSDDNKFASMLVETFCSEGYIKDRNYVRYLAYKNVKIKSANSLIRSEGMKTTAPILSGELMLAYNTTAFDKHNVPAIVNSNDYVIGEITPSKDSFGIEVLITKVTAIDEGSEGYINVVVPTPQNLEVFMSENIPRVAKAKRFGGRAWAEYYAWKHQYALLDDLYQGRQFVAKKDIDYGYGITVHKSQGSTYNTVFVNGRDVNTIFVDHKDPLLKRKHTELAKKKLWYVALSRASNKALIIL